MQEKQLSIFDKPAKPEKVTQGAKIMKYMQDYGSITPVEAFSVSPALLRPSIRFTW